MANKINPTREQLIAQSTDRNLSVTANAGSGKTMVLVERYLGLLLADPNADPRKIVAITFTKKAAAEMLEKVNRRLGEMLRNARSGEINHLNRIREKLSQARIMTIHSFCFALLRDYPIEAGIVPNSSDIDQADQIRIISDAVSNSVEDAIEEKDGKYSLLFSKLDKNAIINCVNEVVSKRGSIMLPLCHEAVDQKARRIERTVSEHYSQGIPALVAEINRAMHSFAPKKTSSGAQQSLIETISALALSETQQFASECSDYDTLGVWLGCFMASASQIFNKDASLKKFVAERISEESAETLRGMKQKIAQIQEVNQFFASMSSDFRQLELEMITVAEQIKELGRSALDDAFAEKQARNGLDFDDMLYLADRLLSDEDACAFVRKGISHLLVDEFQDTDSVQYNIIKKLVPELVPGSGKSSGINLFIVGDAKQSIYGFRNADVRVFEQARFDISQLNAQMIGSGELSAEILTPSGLLPGTDPKISRGDVGLTATFRMQPVICAFVNNVIGSLMDKSLSEFEVDYSPLISARNTKTLLGSGTTFDLSPEGEFYGSVDFLVCVGSGAEAEETDESDSDVRLGEESEYSLVCKYIQKIVGNDDYIIGDSGAERKINYSDIAVLCRNKQPLLVLTNHLGGAGVPFVLSAGDGFYATQEVLDLVSYLNFLHNPKADIALTAILRSPFFGFSDEHLLNLASFAGDSIYDKLIAYSEESTSSGWVKETVDTLARMIEMSRGLQISDLIICLISQSGLAGTVPAGPIGVRARANYEKFVQIARKFESRGFRNLFDFVEELNFLLENEAKEAEAGTIADSDGVNLMTVHASKGLEFPVVILFGTNIKEKPPGAIASSDETGIVFAVKEMNAEGFMVPVQTPAFAYARGIARTANVAEAKRLLYVGSTRAKDRLVISAEVTRKKKSDDVSVRNFLKLICEGLALDPSRLVSGENAIIFSGEQLSVLRDGVPVPLGVRYRVGIANDVTNFDKTVASGTGGIRQPEFRFAKLTAEAQSEIFSASKIMTYANSRKDFVDTYVFGLPEIDPEDEPPATNAESEERIIGSLAGSVIHAVMEQLPRWYGFAGEVDEREFADAIATATDGVENINLELLCERVRNECLAMASTPLLRKWQPQLRTALFEYDMYIPVNNDILMAKIDALVVGSDGTPEIWDWKSNVVHSREGITALVRKYAIQMKVYAYFVMLLHPGLPEYCARLLFTRLAREGAADEDWTYVFRFAKGDLEQFGEFLGATTHDMKAVNFLNSEHDIDYSEGKLEWAI